MTFFVGASRFPWWAAGCSIFATMLSSLTFTGLPSKSFAQDWVYLVGNLTIPVVAVVAVFVALPFFRRIDATSAYEYLEKRFSRSVRLFGSASFTLFHIFRMAVVMSLTGLALAVATPLTPMQSVLLMGVLSMVYCTSGWYRSGDLDRYDPDGGSAGRCAVGNAAAYLRRRWWIGRFLDSGQCTQINFAWPIGTCLPPVHKLHCG